MFNWLKSFLGIGEKPKTAQAIPDGYMAIDKKTLLASVPMLHPQVERIAEKRYGCTLQWDLSEAQHEAPKNSWFPKFFFNKNRKRRHKLVLDDMGRRTVELINGQNTVADIANTLATQIGCDKKAMQDAVLAFISQLARRNAVTLGKSAN